MRSRWRLALIGLAMAIGSGTAQAQGPRTEVVPSGARLNVRTTRPIFADRAWVGMRVPAILDSPLHDTRGRLVVPSGSRATLEVVGVRTRGRDRVTLAADSVRVGRRSFPVSTNHITMTANARTARNAAGGAIGGAVVGGMVGGGSGAAVGAATGGTAGAIASGSSRRNVTVPADTRIRFRTFGPVHIRR